MECGSLRLMDLIGSKNFPIGRISLSFLAIDVDTLSAKAGRVSNSSFSLFGIRLCKGVPNSSDWIDIRIEPEIYRSGKSYYIGITLRQSDWEEFKKQVESISDTIEVLLKCLEYDK